MQDCLIPKDYPTLFKRLTEVNGNAPGYVEDIALFKQHNKLTRALAILLSIHIIRLYPDPEFEYLRHRPEAEQFSHVTRVFRDNFNKGIFNV